MSYDIRDGRSSLDEGLGLGLGSLLNGWLCDIGRDHYEAEMYGWYLGYIIVGIAGQKFLRQL